MYQGSVLQIILFYHLVTCYRSSICFPIIYILLNEAVFLYTYIITKALQFPGIFTG